MGRHKKPNIPARVTKEFAVTTGVIAGAAVLTTGPHPIAEAAQLTAPQPAITAPITTAAFVKPHPAVAQEYTVRPGDTLYGIAADMCGNGEDWPGLYRSSRLGPDPNLIFPGEKINVNCHAGTITPAEHDVSGAGPAVSVYANPLRAVHGLQAERIDMGVDYTGTGVLYAVGPGEIMMVHESGWPNGVYIVERLTAGPLAGRYVYYAEDISPNVQPGQEVSSSTVIGTLFGGSSGIEIGWADPGNIGDTAASAAGQYVSDGTVTAYGVNMSDFLHSLGAPAGIHDGSVTGAVTGGYYQMIQQHVTASQPVVPVVAGDTWQNYLTVARFLMSHGYTRAAAAGIVACIAGESGGNPESQGGGGGGLIGFTPLPAGYVTGDITADLYTQVNAILKYNNGWSQYLGLLNSATGPLEAADIYSRDFERPAVQYSDVRSSVAYSVYAAI